MESSTEVLDRATRNKSRSWALSDKNPLNAANRMQSGNFVPVAVTPKFKLSREGGAFTIGSCFARNVEYKLRRLGVPVLTADFSLPAAVYSTSDPNTRDHRGVLNKYNPHSMKTEILRALGELTDIPDEGFIHVGDGQWIDPQASSLLPNTLDAIREIRGKLNAVNSRIRGASTVFITLGLTETWYDSVTGMSLNQAPNPKFLRRFPDRFTFRNATFPETETTLRDIVEAIKRHSPEVRIILTVSPVPLGNTFTGDDIITANARSKATLLCAARAVAEAYPFVDYFPSYEMATHSPRGLVWKEDGVHVLGDMVTFIMQQFESAYF